MKAFLALLSVAVLCGCGQPNATQVNLENICVAPSTPAPHSVVVQVARLRRDYEQSDWTGVGSQIQNSAVAQRFVQRMKHWQYENIGNLKIAIVYGRRVSPTKYVATVRFAVDSRAIPDYRILVFKIHGKSARIIGTTSGIAVSATASPRWSVTRTSHFSVYHSPYQLVGSDKLYLASLEFQRTEFHRKFGVKLPAGMVFFL